MMLKVLDTDGAVRRVSGGWTATGLDWAYDAERYERVSAERAREQQAMLGYIETAGCRMEYLRRELDDPEAAACGRCDNCTGQYWPQAVPAAAASAAADRLNRAGVEIAPRKMWPTGMPALGVAATGKITLTAEPGRALARLTDLGWGRRLQDLLAGDDGPVTGDIVAAVVRVLADWNWDQRPAAVLSVPSRTRPVLINTLATTIAEIGRMPHLGSLELLASEPPGQQHNSAQRLRAVWQTLAVPASVGEELAVIGGPVLLVDDLTDTGWTMTVAAVAARAAGAPAILPFALATAAP